LIHQRDEYKSEADRLKMKVDSYFKEIESLKLNLKNQRKSVYTSQQAAGGQGFTSGVYKNFNLGG